MKRDGGPAFPIGEVHPDNADQVVTGMSLRDYFAAKFAAAWVIAFAQRWREPGCSDTDVLHEANRRGLEQADAMLRAKQ